MSPLAMAEWIEIAYRSQYSQSDRVSASDGGVDWNSYRMDQLKPGVVSASDGGVDWNKTPYMDHRQQYGLR